MEGFCKIMCQHCPIEKSPNGACYDISGNWSQDKFGNWVFNGQWKCIYYNKETDSCGCPMDMSKE